MGGFSIVQPSQSVSSARAYFEYIRNQADPFAYLSSRPSQSQTAPFFEEEWIDFKGRPQNDKDARGIWSKALSGYANITDGLVIWGIDARKMPPRNIDAASGLRLIIDPHAFESQLRDWIRDATNPPVIGVEYQSYPGPSGQGFVVCLVPESNHKPHRAEFADKHYYYRAGDDFLPAEPGLLRTLFYPQLRPHLTVEVTLRFQLNPTDLAGAYRTSSFAFNKVINSPSYMYFDVVLHNTGTTTAKDTYVVVQASDGLDFHQGTDWDMRPNPRGHAAFQARRPLHPGEATELFTASFQQAFGNNTVNDGGIVPYFQKVHLRFVIYAECAQPQEIIAEFIREDLSAETGSAIKQALPVV
jgi:hypothetical protein